MREALADWPNCAWGDEGGALTVSTWESVRDPDLQLLDMELTLHHGERMWTVQVQVGTERPDEIVVQEVCRHTPDLSQPPIDEMPDVLGFLAEYPSMDEDSRFACRVYSLMPAGAGVFAGFVRGADRETQTTGGVCDPPIRGCDRKCCPQRSWSSG